MPSNLSRICIACGGATKNGRSLRCVSCRAKHIDKFARAWQSAHREKMRAFDKKWRDTNIERHRASCREYYRLNKAKISARHHGYVLKKRALVVASSAPLLSYPFISKPRDEHAEILLINSLVPRGMPGREDICQEIMVALWEGRTSIDELKVRGVGSFIQKYRRENFENAGFVVSLSQPRFDGRTWDALLPDTSGAFELERLCET